MMKHTTTNDAELNAFLVAVHNCDLEQMRRLVHDVPRLFEMLHEQNRWVMCDAARWSPPDVVRLLIELGGDVNEQDCNGFTAVSAAVAAGRYDAVKLLLEFGADPDKDCPIFAVAVSIKMQIEERIAMAKLLLDYGADINQPKLGYGLPAPNVLSESLELGRTELVEFLKSRGAKLPDVSPAADSGEVSASDILLHFRKHYGQPEKRVIREIVPTSEVPLVIHYISSSANKENFAVLFTEGVSRIAMSVPEGAEQYRRAELMIALDSAWPRPEKAIRDPRWAWPFQWMAKIATYPVANNTWLGARLSTMAESVPPQPLGPDTKFTSWLLVSLESEESVIRCNDGTRIQIYQLFPLYTEEYMFAREHGADTLMNLLIKHEIQEHVDPNRPNVITITR